MIVYSVSLDSFGQHSIRRKTKKEAEFLFFAGFISLSVDWFKQIMEYDGQFD
jgi:hypothetical protein